MKVSEEYARTRSQEPYVCVLEATHRMEGKLLGLRQLQERHTNDGRTDEALDALIRDYEAGLETTHAWLIKHAYLADVVEVTA